jgi:hypothetical protein
VRILEDYFEALRSQDWTLLSECLAENVRRTGPYLDVVEGRKAYLEYLSRVIPKLPNYELRVRRTRELEGGSALAELSEFTDVDGVRTEFPELIVFDFDAAGAISRVDIYLKQPGGPRK